MIRRREQNPHRRGREMSGKRRKWPMTKVIECSPSQCCDEWLIQRTRDTHENKQRGR